MKIGDILHFIIEQVAIDTGILLSSSNIKEAITESEMSEWGFFFDGSPDEVTGVRPEFIEDIVRVLRVSVGNLPDATPGFVVASDKMRDLLEKGFDVDKIIEASEKVISSKKDKIIDEETINEITKASKQDRLAVIEFFTGVNEYLNRSLKMNYPDVVEWNGAIELSKLFDGEIIPDDPDEYFDQRFLDYLAKNEGRLENMHWRNFERLCAEFFKRKGFIIKLSPPTKDGGIDIRIWSNEEYKKKSPFIVVQCKRYKKSNKVDIEYVKAFWTDLEFENAKRGLLATTSHIAIGGKKICKVRKWPLSIAENESVNKWVKSMWRFKPEKIKIDKGGVGNYLLPPFTSFFKP
jgi:restriction system protein